MKGIIYLSQSVNEHRIKWKLDLLPIKLGPSLRNKE